MTPAVNDKKLPSFATFWRGSALPPYDLACLYSFVKRGYKVAVYSYEPIADLPDWLTPKDAGAILPPETVDKFVVDGKPSLAHFADHFRFQMFMKTDEIWIDTDIVLLKDFDTPFTGNMMGYEDKGRICTAILRLDPADSRSRLCLDRVDAMAGKPIKWGDTGPRLLTQVYGGTGALPQHVFYPVHYNDFYKVFVPDMLEECETLCKDAQTLHLWNHIVAEMGVYKKIGPPKGSYLYKIFEEADALKFFSDFYPASVIKYMVSNVIDRPSKHAGVLTILKLLPAAIKLTILRRLGLVW